MPTSHPESRRWAFQQFKKLSPKTVLDVGVGCGTYSDLLRTDEHWIGIEAWKPYVSKYQLRSKYDEILIADFRLAEIPHVDLAIVGDCIEHVSLGQGREFIDRLKGCAKNIILVVPLGEYPQGEVDSNPFEAHVSTWEHDFAVEVMRPKDWFIGDVVGAYLWQRESAY